MKTRFCIATVLLALNALPTTAQISMVQSMNSNVSAVGAGSLNQSFNSVDTSSTNIGLPAYTAGSISVVGSSGPASQAQCIEGCMDPTYARALQMKMNLEALKKEGEEIAKSPIVLALEVISRRSEEEWQTSLRIFHFGLLVAALVLVLTLLSVWRVGRA